MWLKISDQVTFEILKREWQKYGFRMSIVPSLKNISLQQEQQWGLGGGGGKRGGEKERDIF